MQIDLDTISKSKHILISTDSDSFANASAIYSYMLTLHKKVSITNINLVDINLSFLAWFDKLRETPPSSADFKITTTNDTKALFEFFKDNEIKINKKMATALYAGLLKRYKQYSSSDCDGTIFAIASELISLGAEYKICNEFLLKKVSLATMRLKSMIFKSMLLKESATHAYLFVSSDVLKASGATLKEAYSIMDDAMSIVNVKRVTLCSSDENNKILKSINEEK